MPTALAVTEAVLKALAPFVPQKRIAGGSGSAALVLGGRDGASNRPFVHYEILSGGTGARSAKDGVSATAFHLSNCKTAPVEIIESEFPARVERFEMIPDSGGAGEWRGGLGFARDYRILTDEVRFSMRTDKLHRTWEVIREQRAAKAPASSVRRRTTRKDSRRASAVTGYSGEICYASSAPAVAGSAIRSNVRWKESSRTSARGMSPSKRQVWIMGWSWNRAMASRS